MQDTAGECGLPKEDMHSSTFRDVSQSGVKYFVLVYVLASLIGFNFSVFKKCIFTAIDS